jgi:purine-cytosine permease-like protein
VDSETREGAPTGEAHAPASRRQVMREDYALERLPTNWRWGSRTVFMVLAGIITAFFFPATGGTYLLSYGATATFIGLAIGFVLLTGLTLIVSSAASREGLTSDLLTRGCGYGFLGSAFTCLIYAFTFCIYAGLEGQILATSLHTVVHIPIGYLYVIAGLLFIPLTWYGMSQLSWTMWISFPIYVVLLVLAIVRGLDRHGGFPAHFFTAHPAGAVVGGLGILGVMAGLSGTIGLNPMEYSDYNRFIPPGQFRRAIFPTVVLPNLLMFFFAFPLGVFFTLLTKEVNPGVYFVGLLGTGLGVLFAWVTQVRINVTNVYSGSLAFANFFARVFEWSPTRIVWVILVSVASIGLMFGDVLTHLLSFLEWDGIYLLAWVATVVADLTVVKRWLHIGPPQVEYEKDKLYAINPVGVVALIAGVGVGSFMQYAVHEPALHSLAPYFGFVVAFVVHVVMAVATQGRWYLRPGVARRSPARAAPERRHRPSPPLRAG